MNEAQTKAWNCLTDKEKQSLFLQYSEGKSTWEIGEMLKLSHYKYLEIRERSSKFFKMFTEFFELHPSIFRPGCPCKPAFIDYIEGCIERRMSRKDARFHSGDASQLLPEVTYRHIERNMKYLKRSEDPWDLDTMRLIFEFDRWNNFRILPPILQQPSAYKRRSNKKDKIYIRYLLYRIPEWIHHKLIERFKYHIHRNHPKPAYWVALISDELYTDGYLLLPVRPTEEVVKEFNKFYIYVFKDKDDADTFGFMVSKFMLKTNTVRLGQKFWPDYRYCVEKAVNYNEVNNIEFNVKSLDMAYNTHIFKKPRKKKKLAGEKRVPSSAFY